MKKLGKVIPLFIIAVLLTNCSSTNEFMVKDTKDYQKATSKILGDWGVTKYIVDGENLLKTKYEKMTANFDFPTRTVKFTIFVSENKIAEKLLDWREKYPNIKIDEYKIVYRANWEIADDIFIYFREPVTELVIKGEGENFEGFYAWEKSKFEMAKSMDDGSLLGSVTGSLAQAATGTSDLFPEFSSSYKYKIDENGNSFSLTDGDDKIVMTR